MVVGGADRSCDSLGILGSGVSIPRVENPGGFLGCAL